MSSIFKSKSFRSVLFDELDSFLQNEEMQCSETLNALVELVVALSHYTEEGSLLYPQVLLCDNLDNSLSIIQGSGAIEIGSGPKGDQTMRQALKKCAPLAKSGWYLYVNRDGDFFRYGVFRTSNIPTALGVRDTLLDLSSEHEQRLNMILVSQLSEKAVELVGTNAGCLHLYLSAAPENIPSPQQALDSLIRGN